MEPTPDQSEPAEVRIRIDHGSVPVGDLDEGIRFYGEVVGLERIERPDFGFPGAWFLAGSTPLHLTTGGTLRGTEAPLRPNEGHIAFCVDKGLETLLTRVRDSGAPVYELENSPAAERQVFVLDPWGNMLEFCRYEGPSAADAQT